MMGPIADQTDIQGIRDREPQAIQQWFERFADPLYAYVFYRVCRDEGLASDVVQETFLQAMAQIDHYDPARGSMHAWLTTLSRNHVTRALKSRGLGSSDHQRQLDEALFRSFAQVAEMPLPDEVLERQETQDLVRETLANIPGNYRTVLTLHYHRGLSLAEIAQRANKTQGAIKVLLHRARTAFREAFLRLSRAQERGLL